MSAYFADIRQWGVYSDYKYTPNEDLKGWSNDHPFPPEIRVDSPYLKARQDRLAKNLSSEMVAVFDQLSKDNSLSEAFEAWTGSVSEFLKKNPGGWEALAALPEPAKPATKPATKPAGAATANPAKPASLPGGFATPAAGGGQDQ